MASTSNAENFMKIARIVYQLCDYPDFRADFLQTRICGKWLVFANQVTYINHQILASYSTSMGILKYLLIAPTADMLLCSRVTVNMGAIPATPLPCSPTYRKQVNTNSHNECLSVHLPTVPQSHPRESRPWGAVVSPVCSSNTARV